MIVVVPEPRHLEEEPETVVNLAACGLLTARLDDIEAHNIEEIRNLEVHSLVNFAFTFGEEHTRRLVDSLDQFDLHVLLRDGSLDVLLRDGSLDVTDNIIRVTLW